LCKTFESLVEGVPRATGGFPCGKSEKERRPLYCLSSCCVVVTGKMTRHIEQKGIYLYLGPFNKSKVKRRTSVADPLAVANTCSMILSF